MTMSTAPVPSVDVAQAVRDVLLQADRPLTVNEIHRDLTAVKIPKPRVLELLRDLIQERRAFLCSPAGQQDRYWGFEEYQKVFEKAQELLAEQKLAENDLVKALAQALPKVSGTPTLRQFVQRMRTEGRLFEHPVKGRSTRQLGREAFDPSTVVQLNKSTVKNLVDVLQKIESFGGGVEQVLTLVRRELTQAVNTPSSNSETKQREKETASPGQTEEIEIDNLILKGMRDLVPNVEQEAFVSLGELRRNMPAEYQGRDVFDLAVLRLAEQGKLQLQRDDGNGSSAENEGLDLVRDDDGVAYQRAGYRNDQ